MTSRTTQSAFVRTLGRFSAVALTACVASSAMSAPILLGTYGTSWPSASGAAPPRPLAMTGPYSVDPTVDVGKRYLMIFEFDEPIIAAKGATATNASVVGLHVAPGQPYVTVEMSDIADATHIQVSIEKVAGLSGVFPNVEGAVSLLRGDYNGDGTVNAADLIPFLDSADGADPLAAAGLDNADGPTPLDDFITSGRSLPNLLPVVSEIGTMHAAPGSWSLPRNFRVRDDRLAVNELTFVAESTNPTLLPFENIHVLGREDVKAVAFEAPAGQSGACTIEIYVIDDAGTSLLQIPVVIKADEAADARFHVDHHVGVAPLTVRFDASATSDVLANAIGYLWDFGDGATAAGREVSHVFDQPGEYAVTLSVTDASGLMSTETRLVTVADGALADGGPITEAEARRFLWQAAFGPTDQDVSDVMAMGYEAWIDQQIAMPATLMDYADLEFASDQGYHGSDPGWIFDDFAVEAPDQLRQRMAWALIQIIVMHQLQDGSGNRAEAQYYSQYIQQGLGNYRDLLEYVTFSYSMATYLTYRNSSKANPNSGSVPDENYAREIKQLFSIGLWSLDPNGTRSVDIFGDEYANYDNEDIREFARVFTGLRRGNEDYDPLVGRINSHDFGEKQLLSYPGVALPGGVLAASEEETEAAIFATVRAAIDNVFEHPSCAPFIAHRLIQRMTSSNPTPAYVRRVADAFEGLGPFGSGVRGDLAATAKAILLDPEARDPTYRSNPYTGKVIEPLILHYGLFRVMQKVDEPTRPFPFRIDAKLYWPMDAFRQNFMESPTVFNFYQPTDAPIGSALDRGGLVAPELKIHDDLTAISAPNLWMREVISEDDDGERSPLYDQWLAAAAGDDAVLVDLAIADLLHVPLTPEARAIIVQAVSEVNGDYDKVRAAASLIVFTPEFTVLK